MLLSRRRAALGLLLAVKLAGCAEEAPRDRPSPVPIKGSTNEASGYTGSKLCRTCHPDIYEAWTSSRHSYSILTASQARAAGYPLPPSPVVASWDDVAYTIGGRKRIAYADSVGNVLGHRLPPSRGHMALVSSEGDGLRTLSRDRPRRYGRRGAQYWL